MFFINIIIVGYAGYVVGYLLASFIKHVYILSITTSVVLLVVAINFLHEIIKKQRDK